MYKETFNAIVYAFSPLLTNAMHLFYVKVVDLYIPGIINEGTGLGNKL